MSCAFSEIIYSNDTIPDYGSGESEILKTAEKVLLPSYRLISSPFDFSIKLKR